MKTLEELAKEYLESNTIALQEALDKVRVLENANKSLVKAADYFEADAKTAWALVQKLIERIDKAKQALNQEGNNK